MFCFFNGGTKVQVNLGGKPGISRNTIDLNEPLLEPLIKHLGTRVGVETISFNIEAFFQMLQIPITRS